MLHHIRPNKLFAALDAEGPERTIRMRLPKRRGLEMWDPGVICNDAAPDPSLPDYSLTSLETLIILAGMKITTAERVFEFGTHLGATTLNIALNLSGSGRIYTMDLMPTERFKEWKAYPSVMRRILSIGGRDSTAFDFSGFARRFDFVWIDGRKDRLPDTVTAFELVSDGGFIGWHDYGNPDTNVNAIIESLAESKDVFHIEDSKVCLYFQRPPAGLLC